MGFTAALMGVSMASSLLDPILKGPTRKKLQNRSQEIENVQASLNTNATKVNENNIILQGKKVADTGSTLSRRINNNIDDTVKKRNIEIANKQAAIDMARNENNNKLNKLG